MLTQQTLDKLASDQGQGMPRITFGLIDLVDGISFLLLVMATFAAPLLVIFTMCGV